MYLEFPGRKQAVFQQGQQEILDKKQELGAAHNAIRMQASARADAHCHVAYITQNWAWCSAHAYDTQRPGGREGKEKGAGAPSRQFIVAEDVKPG
eukprot:1157594-Pelagomonas_calceolata.AAC.10